MGRYNSQNSEAEQIKPFWESLLYRYNALGKSSESVQCADMGQLQRTVPIQKTFRAL